MTRLILISMRTRKKKSPAHWLTCAILALLPGMSLAEPAREPSRDPMLRIETGMHTTLIRRVVADPAHNRLVTCSDDKTIRVWQMPEARLVSTLRIPIDAGHEGQLFALALSPDGNTVAAAGWTGWDWDSAGAIYLLDIFSGELVRRIGGLHNTITALNWTPDGKHLVVGLHGQSGLRVIRLADGAEVASDIQYKERIIDIDIAANGRIAVAGLDGWVRLYSAEFKLIGRRAIEGGKHASAIRFSPDSQMLAVSFLDTPAISVVDAGKLAFLYSPDLKGLQDFAGFAALAWSSDGNYLYAGGDYRGADRNPLLRWPAQGRGKRESIPLAINRINELRQLPDGHIAYATEDPGFGIVSPQFKPIGFRSPDIINFSRAQGRLQVSDDGNRVRYPVDVDGSRFQQFDVLGPGDQSLAAGEALTAARLAAPDVVVRNWDSQTDPAINGHPVELEPHEMARSYAITPDGKGVLLGAEWSLRLLGTDGKQRWSQQLPAVSRSVTVSGNGRLAIAALSDGTIRWFRIEDGSEVVAYFPHANGSDWIAWVPDGYYASSVYGDNYVGWHLNRGKEKAPDFYRAVQFERILYRPDVVESAFRAETGPRTRSLGDIPADASFRIDQLRQIAPPRLRLRQARLDLDDPARPRLRLRLDGERNALPMEQYTVFVNKIPVTPAAERVLEGEDRNQFTRELRLDLPARINDIRVEAFNGKAMGVSERHIELPASVEPQPVAGDLYLLAIGINEFSSLPRSMHLQYAARDAEQVAAAFAAHAGRTFGDVHVQVLSDTSTTAPSRAAILNAMNFAAAAGPHDTVMIFLASHGVSDKAGNYFFVPQDVAIRDISRAMKGEPAESMVPWNVFFDSLRQTSGYRMLIVDTCHAQDIEGRFDAHSLMKRSAASLFPLMVAARGDEQSQEYAQEQHGLFTYALLQALAAAPDTDADGTVSLQEVFARLAPEVDRLHVREAGSQTPQLVAPPPLERMPVLREAGRSL